MDVVEVEQRDRIRILRLNRPAARNAMDTALLATLLDAIAEATADPHVAVVVFTGAGDTFSAGADLREVLDTAGAVRRIDLFGEVYAAVANSAKPTVAAVAGHCVGGGIEVAAACDIRVADPTASFRFPGAALGIPVGAAKLVGLVGLGAAKDLVLTSRTFDAHEAVRLGFVQRLAPAGGALELGISVAGAVASNSADAVAFLRRQFASFSGTPDRVAAENDALHALTEAEGDYTSLTMPNPKGVWPPGSWA